MTILERCAARIIAIRHAGLPAEAGRSATLATLDMVGVTLASARAAPEPPA